MRDPTIRTAPGHANLNNNGHIFGGWILSQMDVAGGIAAARRADGAVATVAVNAMKFLRPVLLGDLLSVYTEVAQIGRTSITISVEVCVDRRGIDGEIKVTEGCFTFVALDAEGRPRPIDPPRQTISV
ncbi:MAG: hotdog domain-containing protein [Pseudomonadota bacterium]